jgi:hypothetical protein
MPPIHDRGHGIHSPKIPSSKYFSTSLKSSVRRNQRHRMTRCSVISCQARNTLYRKRHDSTCAGVIEWNQNRRLEIEKRTVIPIHCIESSILFFPFIIHEFSFKFSLHTYPLTLCSMHTKNRHGDFFRKGLLTRFIYSIRRARGAKMHRTDLLCNRRSVVQVHRDRDMVWQTILSL